MDKLNKKIYLILVLICLALLNACSTTTSSLTRKVDCVDRAIMACQYLNEKNEDCKIAVGWVEYKGTKYYHAHAYTMKDGKIDYWKEDPGFVEINKSITWQQAEAKYRSY